MKRTLSTYVAIAILALFGLGGVTGGTVAIRMVDNSLQEQAITFGPDTPYAGQQVTSGLDAYRFQKVIKGHVAKALKPLGVSTFEQVSALSRASATPATPAGDPKLAAARRIALDGELLRGTLFSSFAWWIVGWVGVGAGVAFLLLAGLAIRMSNRDDTLFFPLSAPVQESATV